MAVPFRRGMVVAASFVIARWKHMADSRTSPKPPQSSDDPYGAQRFDVPYRWPRGPSAPAPREKRAQNVWFAAAIIVFVAALALIWMMIRDS
jgi:hypothetical protein